MSVYCDHNAGSPIRPEAAEAVVRAFAIGGNPSSVHARGRAARKLMEDAREQVATSVGASAENVIFTSGATEALHLALRAVRGVAQSLVLSAIEHDALWEEAPNVDLPRFVAPMNGDGAVDLAALEQILAEAPRPALVAVMLANNETGAVQPIARAATLVREAGGMLLVDAAQGLGRIPVSLADLDASYLVLSSHKIGGPQGAGALILASGAPFAITQGGGGQERGRRPGTENVPAIVGFGVAAELAARDDAARVRALRDRFEAALLKIEPNAAIFARDAVRLPNTSLFAIPGWRAETALIALDLEGVCASSGAACSSGKVRASRVLTAMGVSPDLARCALRVSFGWSSMEADVDAALNALTKLRAREAA
ncbi:MAG: cysteine desulfurase family protein [Hyphomonadaceae bacterium]